MTGFHLARNTEYAAMSPPFQFYAFVTPESHTFFLWLTGHSGTDLKALVDRAMDEVEDDGDYQVFGDVSRACRGILAGKLRDVLAELDLGVNAIDPPDLGPDPATVAAQLFAFAARGVDPTDVAEAVLRLHGKWSPDDSIPEIR